MPRELPVLKSSQVLRALERAGFQEVARSGSHVKLRRETQLAIVPDHGGKDMPLGTLRSILKQAGSLIDEFRTFL